MVWKKPFFKRVSSKKTSFVLQLFTVKSIQAPICVLIVPLPSIPSPAGMGFQPAF
jgi:hypothetical protein